MHRGSEVRNGAHKEARVCQLCKKERKGPKVEARALSLPPWPSRRRCPPPQKPAAAAALSRTHPNKNHRNSSIMLCSGGSPTHARKKFSSAARCRLSAFTTGAPLGTSGALVR